MARTGYTDKREERDNQEAILSVEDKFCVLHYYNYFSNKEEMVEKGVPLLLLGTISNWGHIEDDDIMYGGIDIALERIVTNEKLVSQLKGTAPSDAPHLDSFDLKPLEDDELYANAVKTVLWQVLKQSGGSSKEEAKEEAEGLMGQAFKEMDTFLHGCLAYFIAGVEVVARRNSITAIPSDLWKAFQPRCGNAIPFRKFKTGYLLKDAQRRLGVLNLSQKREFMRHIKRRFRGNEPEFYLDFEFDGNGKLSEEENSPTDDIGWQ